MITVVKMWDQRIDMVDPVFDQVEGSKLSVEQGLVPSCSADPCSD